LLEARAAAIDLKSDATGEHRADRVGVAVGDRPDPLGALQAHDLAPQVLRVEEPSVARPGVVERDEVAQVLRVHAGSVSARAGTRPGGRTAPIHWRGRARRHRIAGARGIAGRELA
jgi:hypothetical protein